MRKRIGHGVSANAFGQGVTILIQIASLPIFLSIWDLSTYGKWLMMAALPAYFAMSDIGLLTAAANRMTMLMGAGEIVGARRTLHSATAFMSAVCLGVALLTAVGLIYLPLPMLQSPGDRWTLWLLVLATLAAMYSGIDQAVFRATGRYATGILTNNFVRLAEWLGGIAALLVVGHAVAVALAMALVRVLSLRISWQIARHGNATFGYGLREARWMEVKELVKPGLAFLAFQLSSALSLQGFTLLVGSMFGSAAVVTFSAARTLARVAVQATSILSHALWPEFSRLKGAGETQALQALYARSIRIGGATAVALSAVLAGLAPWILPAWTRGEVSYQAAIVLPLLAYAAVAGAGHIPRGVLMSTNGHGQLAIGFTLVSALSLPFAWALGLVWALAGVCWSLLLAEATLTVFSVLLARRQVGATLRQNAPVRP
ncbi:MAG: oligosaccharide flippase family protein [Burkholderiales bacterium]|nr:oligosaccharide flippase family protein [Burkholderiales bacterium]